MNSIQWTCDECETVNVIVVAGTEATTLVCRKCGMLGLLKDAKPVIVLADIPAVHHSGQ